MQQQRLKKDKDTRNTIIGIRINEAEKHTLNHYLKHSQKNISDFIRSAISDTIEKNTIFDVPTE
jgi:uncharacterized protein (DUF1778 family)